MLPPALLKIPCVILSGGKSRRMGEDKSLLPFCNSNSLIQYQYERLEDRFEDIYISSKVDKFDFLKKKEKYLILDQSEIFSPIVALQTIFKTIKSSKVFIITVDTPFVSIGSINKLINNSYNSDICVAQTVKIHNLCGLFSTNLVEFINKMLIMDIHKVNYLLENNNTKRVEFTDDNEFINLNNKDEYQRSLSIINKY